MIILFLVEILLFITLAVIGVTQVVIPLWKGTRPFPHFKVNWAWLILVIGVIIIGVITTILGRSLLWPFQSH